jgi:hypothetical protein
MIPPSLSRAPIAHHWSISRGCVALGHDAVGCGQGERKSRQIARGELIGAVGDLAEERGEIESMVEDRLGDGFIGRPIRSMLPFSGLPGKSLEIGQLRFEGVKLEELLESAAEFRGKRSPGLPPRPRFESNGLFGSDALPFGPARLDGCRSSAGDLDRIGGLEELEADRADGKGGGGGSEALAIAVVVKPGFSDYSSARICAQLISHNWEGNMRGDSMSAVLTLTVLESPLQPRLASRLSLFRAIRA